jgi:integrase
MSLRKRCGRHEPPTLADGSPNPFHCPASPRCDHYWFYDFRVNGRRYRNTTETADKQQAKNIEAKERGRILDGRHGIRRQPDITFKAFAETYVRDHAELHKRSVDRDREIIKMLNRSFGSLILHELTAHRIEQFKRDRLAGKWRGHNTRGAAKPIKPATVNRELDTLKSILSKAVEWGKLLESPARAVKRLKVDNRRTRILTDAEQHAILGHSPRKLRAIVALALVTGARISELLELRWEHCQDGYVTFWETKNGKARRIPVSPAIEAVLASQPRIRPWVFTNARTEEPYTPNGVAHSFGRAVERAGITSGDVTLHTLRHTALSRMVAGGFDDYTVMAISGHSSTRMLERYTHPTEARKIDALNLPSLGTNRAQSENAIEGDAVTAAEIAELLAKIGGRQEDRTPDLRVANAGRRKGHLVGASAHRRRKAR